MAGLWPFFFDAISSSRQPLFDQLLLAASPFGVHREAIFLSRFTLLVPGREESERLTLESAYRAFNHLFLSRPAASECVQLFLRPSHRDV